MLQLIYGIQFYVKLQYPKNSLTVSHFSKSSSFFRYNFIYCRHWDMMKKSYLLWHLPCKALQERRRKCTTKYGANLRIMHPVMWMIIFVIFIPLKIACLEALKKARNALVEATHSSNLTVIKLYI